MAPGNYTIRVSGFSNMQLEGLIFTNETKLFVNTKQISLFIQTNKPYYNQNQKGRKYLYTDISTPLKSMIYTYYL